MHLYILWPVKKSITATIGRQTIQKQPIRIDDVVNKMNAQCQQKQG